MFRCVGTDADDCISVYGLRHALCCLGMLSRYEDVAQLVSKYDATDTGTLNYAEFHRLVAGVTHFPTSSDGSARGAHVVV